MVQWLRIHFAMQGTPVPSLVREDSTEQLNLCVPVTGAHTLQLLKPKRLEPVNHSKRRHRDEEPARHRKELTPLAETRDRPECGNGDPAQTKRVLKYTNQSLFPERAEEGGR